MYLSRLMLNPRARRAQKELANPYELHRTLMRAFPDDLKKGDERVLFRVDVDERGGVPTVLLQSRLEPDWSWLNEDGFQGYLLPRSLWPPRVERNPDAKSFHLAFAPGQTLAFRLRANPTEKHWREVDGERKPKRDPLYKEEDQIAWLRRKGEQGGFRVLRVAVAKEGNAYGRQPLEKTTGGEEQRPKTRQLTLHAVRFDGLLQVADPDKFWATVQAGVGSGKGLGFGLLSLARPST